MKGVVTFGIFAFFYLVIIILFDVASGEPRGVQENENVGQSGGKKSGADALQAPSQTKDGDQGNGAKNSSAGVDSKEAAKLGKVMVTENQTHKDKTSGFSGRQASTESPTNDTNPLADLFQITDPGMRILMGSIYGAYQGNEQCQRQAFCMLGNFMRNMPGRDLVFMMMSSYVPAQYSLYFEIFKAAVMYGQNCSVYVCVPDQPPHGDAASAARPKMPAQQQSSESQQQQQQQQQQKRPQSEFNSIPR